MMMGFDPQCYREAFHDLIWQVTMDYDYDSVQDNKTRDIISLPPKRKLLHYKWIYKTKLAADGSTTKYKDWLVEKGYSQVHGMDYTETVTLVARMDSIRLFLAIASLKRWEVHHMDVKSAFLHGNV